MAFQVSPGVNVTEIDASSSVPAIVTSIGGVAGRFAKGPVNEIIEISSEEQLVEVFGKPDDSNYKSWFTAANFLSYSNALKVVRVVNTTNAKNSLSGKVTASSAASGAEQLYSGVAASSTVLYGSSGQEFHVDTTGSVGSTINLHTGLNSTIGDAATVQLLQPRSSTAYNAAAADQGFTLDAAGAIPVRTLVGGDVSIFLRDSTETTGGLLPASRYSISNQTLTFADTIGDTSASGPYYVHHHGTTGKRLVTSGTVATDMTAGFTYPLYSRQSAANLADSGVYGGDGASHVHYFTAYGGTASAIDTSADTITLAAGHGLLVGDAVVYSQATAEDIGLAANTVYYVKTVSTNDVTLASTVDFAGPTFGADVDITGTLTASTHMLHKAFYMPSSSSATNHSKSTAPVEAGIKPYAGLSDRLTIKVAQQSTFQLIAAPGSYSVNNNLIASIQSAAGTVTDGGAADTDVSHAVTDYTTTANSKTIVYSTNLPRTGQTETVSVPAQKAFTLSTPVNITNGESVVVKIDDVVVPVGSALGSYVLSADGTTITFSGDTADASFVPAAGTNNVKVNISAALANTFVYDSANILVQNKDTFETAGLFGQANLTGHEFIARTAGNHGNDMRVYLVDETSFETNSNLNGFEDLFPQFASQCDGIPRADDASIDTTKTSDLVVGGESITQGLTLVVTMNQPDGTEMVVEVINHMSKASNGKSPSGENLYYVDMINERSRYVWAINHPSTSGMDWGTNISSTVGSVKRTFAALNQSSSTADGTEIFISRPFGNGSDGTAPLQSHFTAGYDLYADVESVDVGFLLQGESADLSESASGMISHIINIAKTRKDCIACISPTEVTVAADKVSGNTVSTRAFYANVINSDYAFADSNYKYIMDKYNNKGRFVPFNADTAGLMVRSEQERDAWFSPAGFNRGVYKGVVKTMVEQNKTDRDALYKVSINPVVNFAGQGTVLFGDKTFTRKSSAFDRINVRRLFIVLEKSIATAAKFTLFEFNDEFTRAQFTSLIEPFLRDVKGRRGIYDFKVVCDSTNNTANVIDTNQFVGDIFIQPARSINFIQLNFVAVRTGVSFDEIVGVV
jgi:hypothetical protein